MSAGNQEFIRDMNYHKVLETIIQKGQISRADLSKELGLTKATISSLVQSLLEDGLIEETGSLQTSAGRRPIMLKFQSSVGHVLALDIGLGQINLMLCNLSGGDCFFKQLTWNQKRKDLLPLLIQTMEELLHTPNDYKQIVGISIGIHGVVKHNEILFTPYYDLKQLPLKEELERQFSIPVFIENEANLSALGERTFSFGASSLVNISIHSGIGLGFIMNNALYTGADGFAGEFGHTIIEPQGRPCPCGNQGCLEQYASESAILRKYNQLKNTQGGTIDDLVQDYLKGDGAAQLAIADFITYLSMGINNIVNIFNPQLIVVNSSITANLPHVITEIRGRLRNPISSQCKIVPSTLQDTATLLGGVYVVTKNHLGIADFCPPAV